MTVSQCVLNLGGARRLTCGLSALWPRKRSRPENPFWNMLGSMDRLRMADILRYDISYLFVKK